MATIFVLLSLPVSLYEIAMHLENFNRPKLQTRIIRILFMVPLYAVDRCAGRLARCQAGTNASDPTMFFCRTRRCAQAAACDLRLPL